MTQTVCGFIRVHGHVQNIHIGCHGNERCCRVVAKRRRRRCSGIFVRLLLLPAFLSHTFTFAVFSFPGGGVVVVTAATGCCSFLLSLYFQFLFKSCEIRVESSYVCRPSHRFVLPVVLYRRHNHDSSGTLLPTSQRTLYVHSVVIHELLIYILHRVYLCHREDRVLVDRDLVEVKSFAASRTEDSRCFPNTARGT